MQGNPEDKVEVTSETGLTHTFRSLRDRNFRLYFCGQIVSLSGTWMQGLALSWLVYRLTSSPFALGLVEFCQLFPVLVLALLGGWTADRFDRRLILIVTQVVLAVQAVTLALLTLSGTIQVWQIVCLAVVAGIVTAFEMPARQALIGEMVAKEHLVNAISLNSSLFNAARIVGPGIGAVVVGCSNEGFCFVINALSYLASLTAFVLIRLAKDTSTQKHEATSLKDSIKFVVQHPEISRLLRLTLFMSIFGVQFSVLLPAIVRDVLHQGVDGFGLVRVLGGVGSTAAALMLASRGSGGTLIKTISAASIGFSFAMAAFAVSSEFWLSLVVTLLIGFCLTWQLSATHSLIQLNCHDHTRGKVMSIWTMTVMGGSPLGSLFLGWLAAQLGAPVTLFLCAVVMFFSGLVFIAFKR